MLRLGRLGFKKMGFDRLDFPASSSPPEAHPQKKRRRDLVWKGHLKVKSDPGFRFFSGIWNPDHPKVGLGWFRCGPFWPVFSHLSKRHLKTHMDTKKQQKHWPTRLKITQKKHIIIFTGIMRSGTSWASTQHPTAFICLSLFVPI